MIAQPESNYLPVYDRTEYEMTKQDFEFRKAAPKFNYPHEEWDSYFAKFTQLGRMQNINHAVMKSVMYASLNTAAINIAGPEYSPDRPRLTVLNFQQYAEVLRRLFEPEAEQSHMLTAYRARAQLSGEHVADYVHAKVRMFKRAHHGRARDWPGLYEDLIRGLLNNTVKMQMRLEKPPRPIDDYQQVLDNIIHHTSALANAGLAGEKSAAELIGCETIRPKMTGLAAGNVQPGVGVSIKQEIGAIGAIMDPATINAFQSKQKACFHCRQKDHFIANCPRKKAGLGPVNNVEKEEEEDDPDDINYVKLMKGLYNKPRNYSSHKKTNEKRTDYKIRKQKWINHLMSLAKDEEESGSDSGDEEPKKSSTGEAAESQTPAAARVNTIHELEAEDSALVPDYFLGLGQGF